MNKKDAVIIKTLAELGLQKEPELSIDEENRLKLALNPELQFLQDVEDLFNKSQKDN